MFKHTRLIPEDYLPCSITGSDKPLTAIWAGKSVCVGKFPVIYEIHLFLAYP